MSKFYKLLKLFFEISKNITKIQIALGRIESKLQKIENSDTISEFQVFSQWGEDGIIEYLVNKIGIENKTFIEFGVENYLESNTRFLLINRNWSGLVIDGSIENINNIKSQDIYWKYNLKVVCEFINKKNINSIFLQNNLQNEIGLLSIDIDGNDYWIWDSIDAINPIIVICEYNSVFGPSEKVSIPYDENFIRNKKHYSNIYYGASISAFNYLAEKKGYSMVAGNLNSNNVFFVRNDKMKNLKKIKPEEAYSNVKFRESRNIDGTLLYKSSIDAREIIENLEVVNVVNNTTLTIKKLFNE